MTRLGDVPDVVGDLVVAPRDVDEEAVLDLPLLLNYIIIIIIILYYILLLLLLL